jgi:ABC-type glycerol-3-phosphate transport system substrate-binding protein
MRIARLLLITSALSAAACGSSGSTSATAPSPTIATDTLTGTVPAAVNGAPQSVFNTFTVGQGGGTVTVTLTSAVETLPGGNQNSAVAVGMGVGTASGFTCALPAGSAPTILQAGANSALSGSLTAGTYCVLLTDVTIQPGPVAYTVAVQHP